MKKDLFALAFSDLHVNDWKMSYEYEGDRLQDSIQALRLISHRAKELKVPMLMAGDLIHQPRSISNEAFDVLSEALESLSVPLIGIDGNHDQSKANTHKNISPGWFSSLARMVNGVICVNEKPHLYGQTMIHGIPYMKHNIGFKTYLKRADAARRKFPQFKHIILIHTDLPGAKSGHGHTIEKVENVNMKMLKRFDLVLSGHIHVNQVIAKNILMLGAPYQQNMGEIGEEKGYWEIYTDLTYKFIPIKTIATYKRYTPDKPPKDFKKHIWVRTEVRKEVEDEAGKKFDIKQGRKQIAKAYLEIKEIKNKNRKQLLLDLISKVV